MHRSTSALRGCVFDLGGVVMGSPPLAIAAFERIHRIPSGFVNQAIVHHMPNGAFQRLERGEIKDLSGFFIDFTNDLESFRNHFNGPTNFPPIDGQALFEAMSKAGAEVDRDFYHALFCLRGVGIKVAALTNNFQPTEQTPPLGDVLSGIFDVVVESAVEGVRKPDPEAYRLACQRISCEPSETTFMDDIRMNLKPARALGMETIHVPIQDKRSALLQLETVVRARACNIYRALPPTDVSIPHRLSWKIPHESLPDGGEIVGDAYGHAADPPIILLHGGGQTRHSWTETAITLARAGYFAISIDLRGHGESFWCPEGNYLAYQISRDIDHLMNITGLGKRKPVLCGASLGGLASLGTAFVQSDLVGALVLVDVAPRLERVGVSRILEFMYESSKNGFATLAEAGESVRKYKTDAVIKEEGISKTSSPPSSSSLEGLRKNLRFDKKQNRYFWHWDPKLMHAWVDAPNNQFDQDQEAYKLIANEQLMLQCARNITAPVCLIRGKLTDVVSEAGVQSLVENVPHAVVIDVTGASHMVVGDENDAFSQALLSFLSFHRESFVQARGAPNHVVQKLKDGGKL